MRVARRHDSAATANVGVDPGILDESRAEVAEPADATVLNTVEPQAS